MVATGLATELLELSAQSDKPRLAVLAFQNNTTSKIYGDNLGEAASDEFTTQLVKSGQFSLIERQQIKAILDEQSLSASGAVDPGTAAKVGKLLGAQLVLVGSITQFSLKKTGGGIGPLRFRAAVEQAESKVDARLVNVTTGEILLVAEGAGKKTFGGAAYQGVDLEQNYDEGATQEALRPAIEKAVGTILEQKEGLSKIGPAAPTITVVGVRPDGQVYIDRGQNAELKVGQRLTVTRVTDVIKDARGNLLDEVTEKVGALEITNVLGQSSVCKVVEGAAVKEGDRVSP
jgi:curli biogenesis system outer membrane secretion channel CsgG